jgi:hypothetical protein
MPSDQMSILEPASSSHVSEAGFGDPGRRRQSTAPDSTPSTVIEANGPQCTPADGRVKS